LIITAILGLFKESVEFRLAHLSSTLSIAQVSGSAFSQARYKIRPEFFQALNQLVVNHNEKGLRKRWKGYGLVGGDGSTLQLPSSKEIKDYFGTHSKKNTGVCNYLARTFLFYDLLNDVVLQAYLSPMHTGEKDMLINGMDRLALNDLLVLDRGFGDFTTIQRLKGQPFCIRMSVKQSNFARRVMKDNRTDRVCTWIPSKKEELNTRKHGITPTPIRVRVTKVQLPSGETELLVSNLFDKKITAKDLGKLYHKRWNVEEGFKNLKAKMKVEQFASKKSQGIYQEFYAHIFIMNMVAILRNTASYAVNQNTRHRRLNYKCNWKNTYRYFREVIVEFLWWVKAYQILDDLLEKIKRSIIAIRPGRSFHRDMRHRQRYTLNPIYK
jgi:hypothetical protein